MPPDAYVTHRAPGRIRLRVPGCKGAEDYFADARRLLLQAEGVGEVTTNVRTAGILVQYQGAVPDLDQIGLETELFRLHVEQPVQPAALRRNLRRRIQNLDRRVLDYSNGQLDSQSLMFLGLVSLSLLQAARGNLLPAGLNLLWRAFQLLPESAGSVDEELSADDGE